MKMRRKKLYRSDYLFSSPSFFTGMGSALNIAGNYFSYNYCQSAEEADRKAIQSDWLMVGQDLTNVLKKQLTHE